MHIHLCFLSYHAAPQLENNVSIYNIVEDSSEECDEIRQDTGYIDAISSAQDITDSGSSGHYEEVQ